MGTATSSGTGSVSLTHTPSVSIDYQWVYSGSTAYSGTDSAIKTVQVRTR